MNPFKPSVHVYQKHLVHDNHVPPQQPFEFQQKRNFVVVHKTIESACQDLEDHLSGTPIDNVSPRCFWQGPQDIAHEPCQTVCTCVPETFCPDSTLATPFNNKPLISNSVVVRKTIESAWLSKLSCRLVHPCRERESALEVWLDLATDTCSMLQRIGKRPPMRSWRTTPLRAQQSADPDLFSIMYK